MADTSLVRKQPHKLSAPSKPSDQVSLKTWMGVMGAMLGAFMEYP